MDLETRSRRAEQLGNRGRITESRGFGAQDDGGDTVMFRGYGSTTDREYDMGWYVEKVARTAFDKTLRENPDVLYLGNHGDGGHGMPLAGTRNGTLILEADEIGLHYDASVDVTLDDYARLAARKVDRGLINQGSFAFRITRQTWNDDYTKREVQEVNLNGGDVTFANNGANPETPLTVSARAFMRCLAELDSDLEMELRAAYSPDELTEAYNALGRLLLPSEERVEEVVEATALVDLDTYRARAFALAAAAR